MGVARMNWNKEKRLRRHQWPSDQCALSFTWINDIRRLTSTYSSTSPQHNLAPRMSPCSTLLRGSVSFVLVCCSRFRINGSRSRSWDSWDSDKSWNVKRFKGRGGSTSLLPPVSHTWPYMKTHIPHTGKVALAKCRLHSGNAIWDRASAWCSWG